MLILNIENDGIDGFFFGYFTKYGTFKNENQSF